MNMALPPARRVLVLAPHPDDESLGCGGTIALHVQGGAMVALVVVSDGAALAEERQGQGDLAAERAHETTQAAAVLGIHQVHFLGFPDGYLIQHQEEISTALRRRISDFNPDFVLCPSPIEGHWDHAAVARIMLRLLREMPGWSLAFYELHTPVRPNWLVDISAVLSFKERAILCYPRSLLGKPALFWETVRGLNQFRAFFVHQPGFFEALWIVRAPLTDQEVLDWVTFGFNPRPSEEPTLWTLRGIDELHFAVKEKTTEIQSWRQRVDTLQKEKEKLQRELQAQILAANALQQTTAAKEHELLVLEGSLTMWLRQFGRRSVDRVFPAGSPGRAMINRLNRLRHQYTSKSPSE